MKQRISIDLSGGCELDLDEAFPDRDHVTAAEVIAAMQECGSLMTAVGDWCLPVALNVTVTTENDPLPQMQARVRVSYDYAEWGQDVTVLP